MDASKGLQIPGPYTEPYLGTGHNNWRWKLGRGVFRTSPENLWRLESWKPNFQHLRTQEDSWATLYWWALLDIDHQSLGRGARAPIPPGPRSEYNTTIETSVVVYCDVISEECGKYYTGFEYWLLRHRNGKFTLHDPHSLERSLNMNQ